MSKNILQFGESDCTNLQMYHSEKILDEILSSIDIRSTDITQIEAIIKFINQNDVIIFTGKECRVASKENLRELIKNSSEFKFCENPREFIKRGLADV